MQRSTRFSLAVAALAALTFAPALPAAAVATWSPPVTISVGATDARDAHVVTDGSTITAVWREIAGPEFRVLTAFSTNAGMSWSAPITLSGAGADAANPRVVNHDGTIIVTWVDNTGGRVESTRSTDGGATWEIVVPVSGDGVFPNRQQMVANGGVITVIWEQGTGSNDQIYASTSADDGATWSAPVTVSAATGNPDRPQIATDGTRVTAVWSRSEDGTDDGVRIESASSTDGGLTWSAPLFISEAGGAAFNAQVATDGSLITAIWARNDGVDRRVQTVFSSDGGLTWSTPTTLSDAGEAGFNARVVTDGSTITAIWLRFDGTRDRVQTATSLDGGATWSTPVTLSEAGQNGVEPRLVTDGSTITTVWYRSDGSTFRIQTASSRDRGATWTAPITLSEAGVTALRPELATDGTTITIVWERSGGQLNAIESSSQTTPVAPELPDPVAPELPDPEAPELADTGASPFVVGAASAGLLLIAGGALALRARREA